MFRNRKGAIFGRYGSGCECRNRNGNVFDLENEHASPVNSTNDTEIQLSNDK